MQFMEKKKMLLLLLEEQIKSMQSYEQMLLGDLWIN